MSRPGTSGRRPSTGHRPSSGRRPGSRPRPRLGVVALAGWLFADLLLVLALVSMADRPDPLAAEPEPSPSGSSSPSPSPSASPTPTGPRSVARHPERFSVSGRDRKSLVDQIREATRPWEGRSAALVLTFGGSKGGTDYAHRVNSLLGEARPEMFDKNTATDDFIHLSRPASTAELRVYFYTAPG